jgi:uncharacterized membrane protein
MDGTPLPNDKRLGTKDLALASIFTALYVVFGLLKISPIIGLPGQAITAAALVAPIMGILLGPYVGALATLLGGTIGFYVTWFPLPSLFSGTCAALCSGLLYKGKRVVAFLIYFLLFVFLAFYPVIGPAWLFPTYVWLQLLAMIVLASPLQSWAVKKLGSGNRSSLLSALFLTCLISTMLGQIAGTLTFEVIMTPDPRFFLGNWMTTMLYYPVERVIIAFGAALMGVPLLKVLERTNMMPTLNRAIAQEKVS